MRTRLSKTLTTNMGVNVIRSLSPLIDAAKLFYLRWALAEINPLHPDVPGIVRAINELERKP
jgi:hypothetical protein